jgi:hypothetical protein
MLHVIGFPAVLLLYNGQHVLTLALSVHIHKLNTINLTVTLGYLATLYRACRLGKYVAVLRRIIKCVCRRHRRLCHMLLKRSEGDQKLLRTRANC